MRKSFRGFYPPSEDELNTLWAEALIVLDTNTLLNAYRYTRDTSESFLRTLEAFSGRLWIPHQVGLEYQRRRLDVIQDQFEAYQKVQSAIDVARRGIESEIRRYNRHPVLEVKSLTDKVAAALADLSETVGRDAQKHSGVVSATAESDPIWARLTTLLDGKVGLPYTNEQLTELYKLGEERYVAAVPPGFSDSSKPEPEKYGDLILWMQILDYVEQSPRSVIFVTDDNKEDWWRKSRGKTIGPRSELIDEFVARCGTIVHFYRPEQFLRYSNLRLGAEVSSNVIGEVNEVSQELESIDDRKTTIRERDALERRRATLYQQREYALAAVEDSRRRASHATAFPHRERPGTEDSHLLRNLNLEEEVLRRLLTDAVDKMEAGPLVERIREIDSLRATLLKEGLRPGAEESQWTSLIESRQAQNRRAALWESRIAKTEFELAHVEQRLAELSDQQDAQDDEE